MHLGDIQSAPDRRKGCYRDLPERTAWDRDSGWLFGKLLCNRTGSGASQFGLGLVGSCCESEVWRCNCADLRTTFYRGRRSWHRELSRVCVAMTTPAVCHWYHLFCTQGGGWQWYSDGPIALQRPGDRLTANDALKRGWLTWTISWQAQKWLLSIITPDYRSPFSSSAPNKFPLRRHTLHARLLPRSRFNHFPYLQTLPRCQRAFIFFWGLRVETHTHRGGSRHGNKNETWGLCPWPPADWGRPWEWWSAGSLSLPRRWTRHLGATTPSSAFPLLLLFP